MNDNLRDRVTRVLNRELLAQLPDALSSGDDDLAPSPSGTINLQHLADAVIRYLDSHGWLIDPESGDRARLARPSKPPLFGQHPAIGDHGPIMLNISQKETDE